MRIKEEIVDHEPGRKVCDFSIITFKKTDLSRGAVKGQCATVVDIFEPEKYGFTVQVDIGEVMTPSFFRHEFRLATPLDLKRLDEVQMKRRTRQAKREAEDLTWKNPPETPELGEDAFKIWK